MSHIQSLSQKKRWAKVSQKKRSEHMRNAAVKKWANMSDLDKSQHALKMVKARNK